MLVIVSILIFIILLWGFFTSSQFTSRMENRLYQDEIIYTEESIFQRIVLTRRGERYRFYLNGALQFDSVDEYRYHESLVLPAMLASDHRENILVLGGGDGFAVREILKFPDVKKVTLVDLDPAVTRLFKSNQLLRTLNNSALHNPKVTIVNSDAWEFLESNNTLYDVVIIDLPDPNNASLSRLYTQAFYRLVQRQLAAQGLMVTQATSPLYARSAFWCIHDTVASLYQSVYPYHIYIPSFGEWGFVMASRKKLTPDFLAQRLAHIQDQMITSPRFLDAQIFSSMGMFPRDMAAVPVELNQLSTHPLLPYYKKGWEEWYE